MFVLVVVSWRWGCDGSVTSGVDSGGKLAVVVIGVEVEVGIISGASGIVMVVGWWWWWHDDYS